MEGIGEGVDGVGGPSAGGRVIPWRASARASTGSGDPVEGIGEGVDGVG
ncbi:Hypothetical protein CAP_0541 [Chondromyces apiculatus DSM 436]|uniref:Uncharacterized protein n=1 Tax=Chondromyces apiculatus DSM 436 TaxID=1192034 RepID=A0A017SUR9_9BACT|nr:Hypothetical protein CAP_0541 [Chondromyces apiculatus DSM 436]